MQVPTPSSDNIESGTATFPCYEMEEEWTSAIDAARFWIEGVLLTGVGVVGLIGEQVT
jgi:hypothetical protein